MTETAPPPAPVEPQPPRGRLFIPALAIAALVVGIPLAILATWLGLTLSGYVAAADTREAVCRIAPAPDRGVLAEQERDLRRRIAAAEGELARRQGSCPLCAPVDDVDVAVVVDTSLSMKWPAGMDAAAEAALMDRIRAETGDPLTTRPGNDRMIAEMDRTPAAERRMVAARTAALQALDALPGRARVHLFGFGRFDPARAEASACSVAAAGVFANANRPQLIAALNALEPSASGTPLALSIARAAEAVRGRPPGTPGFAVIVTDGVETCRADPCAAARTAREADPDLTILVIDIAANRQVACLAEATAGRVFGPGGGAEAGRVIAEALRVPPPQACIPRPARAAARAPAGAPATR
ncbi:hypothetical protein [Elioraea sp.]|uniref:hypothetical protein n=1 Tax=Elioraea sp. TaxID=2185103 RepID=UPI003F706F04